MYLLFEMKIVRRRCVFILTHFCSCWRNVYIIWKTPGTVAEGHQLPEVCQPAQKYLIKQNDTFIPKRLLWQAARSDMTELLTRADHSHLPWRIAALRSVKKFDGSVSLVHLRRLLIFLSTHQASDDSAWHVCDDDRWLPTWQRDPAAARVTQGTWRLTSPVYICERCTFLLGKMGRRCVAWTMRSRG